MNDLNLFTEEFFCFDYNLIRFFQESRNDGRGKENDGRSGIQKTNEEDV